MTVADAMLWIDVTVCVATALGFVLLPFLDREPD
jgi:hypothetical protein